MKVSKPSRWNVIIIPAYIIPIKWIINTPKNDAFNAFKHDKLRLKILPAMDTAGKKAII